MSRRSAAGSEVAMEEQIQIRESVRMLLAQGEASRRRAEAAREEMRVRVAALSAKPGEKILAAIREARQGTSH
ncbi:hypothetical protein ACLE20_12200 [Rhizobium sp. YIM 134829]|uniref:hypothetical protein n=1 Tax=Rhizobium sp. YIM 134829 TaxID=3390453 RepID=UPI00397AC896